MIVLDEVHYLSDISRGTVWEEIVSRIYCLHMLFSLCDFPYLFMLVDNFCRLFIAQKKFNLFACQQLLQILMSWLGGLVRYSYCAGDVY